MDLNHLRYQKRQVREKIEKLANEREELLLKIYQKEKDIEEEFEKEENIEGKLREIEGELMSIDTQLIDDEGITELLEGAKKVKYEKNFLIKERKILCRGLASFVKKQWGEREDKLNIWIEKLQEKENYLYEKAWKLRVTGKVSNKEIKENFNK